MTNTAYSSNISRLGVYPNLNHFSNMPPLLPHILPYPHMGYNMFPQGFRDNSPYSGGLADLSVDVPLQDHQNIRVDNSSKVSIVDTPVRDVRVNRSSPSSIVTTPLQNSPSSSVEILPQSVRDDPDTLDSCVGTPLHNSQDSRISTVSSSGITAVVEGSMSTTVTAEKPPMPLINKSRLLTPDEVVGRHPKLVKVSNIPRLSVKLAKDSFFGTEVMAVCTVRGLGNFHGLPETELKQYLMSLCVPRLLTSRIEFEQTWKNCIESIGQACKAARAKKP